VHERWFSGRALLAHLVILIWCPGCLLAGWWQVHVALSGNALSYLYSVEWPAFAVFGLVVWWNFIHDDPDSVGARALRRLRRGSAVGQTPQSIEAVGFVRQPDEEDPELAAYNAYLANLATQQPHKIWRRS
jgi:DNA-binding transcriptional regulator of glucitol operon